MSLGHSSRLAPAARGAQAPFVLCRVFRNFSLSLSRGNIVASLERSPSGLGGYVSTAGAHGLPSTTLGDVEPGGGVSSLGAGSASPARAPPSPALEVELASVACPVVRDATPGLHLKGLDAH